MIIVNYRTPDLTIAALSAIAPEVERRGDTQVTIVDNGSADGSVERLRVAIVPFPWCALLALDDNRGFAAGNNAAIAEYRAQANGAPPRLIWLLNPDTIADDGALSALAAFLDRHPTAGIVGGRCLWPDRTVRHSAFRFPSPLGELLSALDFGPLSRALAGHVVAMPIADAPFAADWLGGSHLMIRGSACDRLGPIDEAYFLYFEETDYCARAAAHGIDRWHVPESIVVHIGGQATGVTGGARPRERRPRYWFESRARFFVRHHGVAKTHLANLLWLVFRPVGSLLAMLRGRPRHDPPRLWRDFLQHHYGHGGLMYRSADLAR